MHLLTTAATLLAAIYVQAVMFTNNGYNGITIGRPFTLTWSGSGSPVSINVLKPRGSSDLLEKLVTLTTTATGTSYTWTPSANIPPGTYALSICQGTASNYSPRFQLSAA
ncbi:hypothetical protein MMC28_011357 [Mycoblastus sanguinarius]|nr:hypothetical protein [Mycoblastus sanguinarius]